MGGFATDMAENIKNALEKEGVLDLNNNERFQDVVNFLSRQLANKNITQIHRKFLQGKTTENIESIRFYKNRIEEVNKEDKANIVSELETFKSEFANNLKEELNKRKNEPKVTQPIKQKETIKKPAAMAYMDGVLKKVEEAKEQANKQVGDINKEVSKLKATTQKIQFAIASAKHKQKKAQDKLEQNVSMDLKQSRNFLERKQKMQLDLFEFKTKNNIKKALSKWWKRIKWVLSFIGLFLLGDVVKKIALGVTEITEPIWRPFIDWTMRNFPALSSYLEKLSEKFKNIANNLKPYVEFFNEITGIRRQRDYEKLKDEINNIKLITKEEALKALAEDGSDIVRMVAYAGTGASLGLLFGPAAPLAAPIMGIAGAIIAFGQTKYQRSKALRDMINNIEKEIAILEEARPDIIDKYQLELADLHRAKLNYNKELLKTILLDYNAGFGLGFIKRKKKLDAAMQAVTAQENKISKIEDMPITSVDVIEGSEADIEMENKLRDYLRNNTTKTKSGNSANSSGFSANNNTSVNTTTNNNIVSDTQDKSTKGGNIVSSGTAKKTSVNYQSNEVPFAPTL